MNLPPFGYQDGEELGGLTYEIGERIASEAGYETTHRLMPLARGVKELADGHLDMFLMFSTPEAEEAAENVGCTILLRNIAVGRKGVVLKSIKDLHGKRIAKIRGAKYDDRLCCLPGVTICNTDNYPQNIRMLFAGRVDLVVGPELGLFYTAGQLGLKRESFGVPLVLCEKTVCVFLSRRTVTPGMRRRIGDAIHKLEHEGFFEQIVESYSLK